MPERRSSTAPKRIGVDLLVLSQFRQGGIVTYTRKLLPELLQVVPGAEWVLFCRSADVVAEYRDHPAVRVKVCRWMNSAWLWKLLGCVMEAYREHLHLLFVPVSRVPLLKLCPTVSVIYDLGFRSLPQYLKRGSLVPAIFSVRHAVKNSDAVLTISEFIRTQLLSDYGADPAKIFLTYCGYDPLQFNTAPLATAPPASVTARYGIRRPYVLYLGVIQGRKNLLALIDAYDVWHSIYPELQLVLAGPRGWNCEAIYTRAARYQPEQICMPGAIQLEHLRSVYQDAECYVLPSLYEGFGIPVVEAMACGTPVIVSRAGALPEIAGDAALYFDPERPQHIAEQVCAVLSSSDLRDRLVSAGLRRVSSFSWEECAKRAARAFDAVLG